MGEEYMTMSVFDKFVNYWSTKDIWAYLFVAYYRPFTTFDY